MNKANRGGLPLAGLTIGAILLASTAGYVSAISRMFQAPLTPQVAMSSFQFDGTEADRPVEMTAPTADQSLARTAPAWLMNALPGYSSGSARLAWYSSLDRLGDSRVMLSLYSDSAPYAFVGTLDNPYRTDSSGMSSPYFGASGGALSLPNVPNATPPDYYWDVNGSAAGLGGTGNWNAGATWNDATGTGTPIVWVNGNNAFFSGVAGTVTINTSPVSAAAMSVETTGYTFTSAAGTRTLTVTGTLSLASNVATTFEINSGTGAATWGVGAISSGTGSSLTLKGGASAGNYDRLQITSESTVSVATVISQSAGGAAGNAIGYYANVNGATVATPKTVNISSNVTNNSTAQFLLGAAVNNTLNFSGTITGTGSVVYSADNAGAGAGLINVTGMGSSYTGATNVNMATTGRVVLNSPDGTGLGATSRITVTKGSLILGADNQIPNTTPMTLAGGTFNTGGFSEHGANANDPGIGALTLQVSSIIDLANGASILAFANSSTQTWTGTLSIYNWSGNTLTGSGTDQLYFGSDPTGLTALQLGQISFYSDAGTTFLGTGAWGTDLDGEVVPTAVPEPSTWIGAGLALAAIGFMQRRKVRRA